jgi:hypothetical protein
VTFPLCSTTSETTSDFGLTRPNGGQCWQAVRWLGTPDSVEVVRKAPQTVSICSESLGNCSFLFFAFGHVRISSRQSLLSRGGCESATQPVRGLDHRRSTPPREWRMKKPDTNS